MAVAGAAEQQQYLPTPGPKTDVPGQEEVVLWAQRELEKIGARLTNHSVIQHNVLHVEPTRPREGMTVVADGDDWDPGSGAGQYTYIGGEWVLTSSGANTNFENKAAVEAAFIGADVNFLRTAGYNEAGDLGGALYAKVDSEPGHEGKIQSADGAWWSLSEAEPMPQMFGAVGSPNTNVPADWVDDTQAFINCIVYAVNNSGGGGKIRVPHGLYYITSTIDTVGRLVTVGSGQESCVLFCGDNDITMVDLKGECELHDIRILGKGSADATFQCSFSFANPTVYVSGSHTKMDRATIKGGLDNILLDENSGADIAIVDCEFGDSYSNQLLQGGNSAWVRGTFFDHDSSSGVSRTNSPPYANWTAATLYNVVGTVVIHPGGYKIILVSTGTSGGSAPALQPYGFNMPDNTATWQLYGTDFMVGVKFTGELGEVHLTNCDFSGAPYDFSAAVRATGTSHAPVVGFNGCVMSAPILINGDVESVVVADTETVGCNIGDDFTGTVHWHDNWQHTSDAPFSVDANATVKSINMHDNDMSGSAITIGNSVTGGGISIRDNKNVTNGISVGNNCDDFSIKDNKMGGGGITIGTGCTNFRIRDNTKTTVTNGSGTSATKVVADNG